MSDSHPVFGLRVARALAMVAVAACALSVGAACAFAQDKPDASAASDSSRAAQKPAARIDLPHIDIPSLDGSITLFGHLFRPKEGGDAPRPAVVMMHGCSGLLAPSGRFLAIYRAWARTLLEQGYVVLVIDSATPRGFGQTCSPPAAAGTMWRERPKDAYAALLYLQAQPFVKADRVAVMGWSQGGGALLFALNERSIGWQSAAGQATRGRLRQDFAAAIAFYPGVCSEAAQKLAYPPGETTGWTTHVPLLVLFGEADVWTELKPCAEFLDAAKARGNPVELKSYPDAVHGFDAPNLKRTELPQYRKRDGRIPVIGTDTAARDDAFKRVGAFLAGKLK